MSTTNHALTWWPRKLLHLGLRSQEHLEETRVSSVLCVVMSVHTCIKHAIPVSLSVSQCQPSAHVCNTWEGYTYHVLGLHSVLGTQKIWTWPKQPCGLQPLDSIRINFFTPAHHFHVGILSRHGASGFHAKEEYNSETQRRSHSEGCRCGVSNKRLRFLYLVICKLQVTT